jgi:hypothetical protein
MKWVKTPSVISKKGISMECQGKTPDTLAFLLKSNEN